jgi:predicted KAP-like P-loop ATPase
MREGINEKEYADDADGDWDSFDDSKMDELEKPEKIYNDEEDSAEQGNFDRALELFGAQIQKVVMDMIDDGYEPEDAVQFLRDLADQMEGGDLFEKKEKMEEKVKPSGEFDWKM